MSDAAAAEERKEVRWQPLESNPEVMSKLMHKLGMSKNWIFTDLYGLDDELLMMVPQPVAALILLFPYTDQYKSFAKTEEEVIEKEGQVVSQDMYYMKQTIRNACGTIAIFHAVLNCRDQIPQDDTLKSFFEETKDLNPEERGHSLESNVVISQAHGESAQEGQTEAPLAEENVCPHFIALIEKEGCVYELDGNKKFPINHGPVQQGFLKSAAKVCQKFIDRDPEKVLFTIMALSQDS